MSSKADGIPDPPNPENVPYLELEEFIFVLIILIAIVKYQM